ncbi:hypothetical protein [Streptomyces sp. NPDC101249]|uniref:hypothetical protein n=1 Tax=Streptomyces sp. NPDC101249 TaxID=3366140 RepID=UPI0037F334C2
MNVNDVVAAKIAAAARRAEETKRRRAALNAARQRGLAHRHAAKLRNQASARTMDAGDSPSPRGSVRDSPSLTDDTEAPAPIGTCSCQNAYACPHTCWHCKAARSDGCEPWCHIRPFDSDDTVIEVTEAEWHDGARTALARLGLTYAQLEDQARRRDFTSAQAQVLWVSIGDTIRPELLNPNTEENQ